MLSQVEKEASARAEGEAEAEQEASASDDEYAGVGLADPRNPRQKSAMEGGRNTLYT